MFSWFKKPNGEEPERPAETPQKSLPTKGHIFSLAVRGPAGEREEKIDLTEILGLVFKGLGREFRSDQGVVTDLASGIEFRPALADVQPTDDLSVRSATTIEVRHPDKFPHPFFEYQHSFGATALDAARNGFGDWSRLDFPVILDATETGLKTCTALEMQYPNGELRRIVLGPVSLWGPPRAAESIPSDACEAHPPFCPCCLIVNSFEAFKGFVESGQFAAIRLFATRGENGTVETDCRVNGENFPDGATALMAYARSWPGSGFEARKQYVIVQDKPAN